MRLITTERNQRHITEAVLPNLACFCWCLTAKRFMEFRKVQQWNPYPGNRKHKLRERILRFAEKPCKVCSNWWVGSLDWCSFFKLKKNWIKANLGSMVGSGRAWYISAGHITPRVSGCFAMIIFVAFVSLFLLILLKQPTLHWLARVKHLPSKHLQSGNN